jgi:IclR family transcriptional regulator, KDG regulon repressor
VQTVNRVFDILEVILKGKNQVSISEIVEATGLNISVVHRIMAALIKRGYLQQEGKRGKYSLGLKFVEYGNLAQNTLDIVKLAKPFLIKLNEQIDETINLTLRNGYEGIKVGMVETHRILRTSAPIGSKIQLHCTGDGKALLAFMPDEEIEKFLAIQNLPYRTQNTIIDVNKLRMHIDKIRKDGVAIDNEETEIGLRSLAVPIRNIDGAVLATIGIVGPTNRLTSKQDTRTIALLKNTAENISQALGYRNNN